MNLKDIAKVIEGVLLVSGEGVDIDEFKTRFDMNDKEFNKCLDILKEKYNTDSGVNIIQYKKKVQLCSNPDIAEDIAEILNPIRERSLTKTALETVAIIAYKQPITRLEIENIRGANSDYAIQLLQTNNLIEVVGRKDTIGKPVLFGTTETFLKRFELESLDKLPNYNELLDRIRVIHSDGESLYREFKIPDEEQVDSSTAPEASDAGEEPKEE
ncbi:MAG: SMC-Scp complex subunit ScpB [Clostridia bacterium]|nr:SMC-Scp complex subunit ScpB [Clostridia bacterium]